MLKQLMIPLGVMAVVLCGQFAQGAQRPTIAPEKAYVDAATVLQTAAEDPDPVTRSQAIEALAEIAGGNSGGVFMEALKSESPAVRFAAAMAIGDTGYESAAKTLLALAGNTSSAEPDKRVLCAIIYSLHRMGNDQYVGQLGALLVDSEKEVRANAAFVMGRMNIRTGAEPLKYQLANETDETVRLNLLEALTRLSDEPSRGLLESYTKWNFLDYRLFAIEAITAAPNPQTKYALRGLLHKRNPIRVRVTAAGALAGLGSVDKSSYELCVEAVLRPQKLLRSEQGATDLTEVEISSVRQLGARALGRMNNVAAIDVLHPLLSGSQGGVRVSAARAILKLLPEHSKKLMATPTPPPADNAAKPPREPSQSARRLRIVGAKEN